MLLTEILVQKQQEIAALFERLGSSDIRSEVGRRSILFLQGKLEEHFRRKLPAEPVPGDRGDQPGRLVVAERRGPDSGARGDLSDIQQLHA